MVNGATASDLELLRQYAQSGCAQSFAQIVHRHVAWVHAASLRQMSGDAHLAEDVTQAVFILLARRASTLPDGTLLTGWLFNTVRYAAAEARRKAARRRKHEAKAAIPAETVSPDSDDHAWRRLAPLLDETVALLRESERQAVLLRYFEDKTFAEIALAMGINEAAARKRVSRGVRKLREVFVNKGVIAPAVAVLTLLLTRAAGAAPAPSFVDALATTAVRVGPPHALALTIVRQTTLRMLRARRRLATAILACAGVCFVGLWALLIASMLEPDATEVAGLVDPFDAADVDLLPPSAGRDPFDSVTVRAEWESRRAPRPPRDRAATPRPDDPHPPVIDRFWRLRGDLDPRNAPTAASTGRAKASLPVRHDRDYDPDPSDTYAGYRGMGGGGGGSYPRDPNHSRNGATPGAVNVAVDRGGHDGTPAPHDTGTRDPVRTAGATPSDNAPAQAAGKSAATFHGNAVELMQSALAPGGNRNAPFRYMQGNDSLFVPPGVGAPRETHRPTDVVQQAIEPYPPPPRSLFGPGTFNYNSDGSVRGSGATLHPVIVDGSTAVTASSSGPVAYVPATANPWPSVRIYLDPDGGPAPFASTILPTPGVTVPEPGTPLFAAAAAAAAATAIGLLLGSRRSRYSR